MPVPSDPIDLQLSTKSFPEGLISILPNPDPVMGPLESTDWDHYYGNDAAVQLGEMV